MAKRKKSAKRTSKATEAPSRDILTLLMAYEREKNTDALPELRDQILKALPEAMEACKRIAESAEVDDVFGEVVLQLEAGLELDRYERRLPLQGTTSKIAQWLRFDNRVQYLKALKTADGDPINHFVQFASVAFHLADDALTWFPEKDPFKYAEWQVRNGIRTAAVWATPAERSVLSDVISPGGVIRFHETLFGRASQAARDRGEGGFALPKLERIEKGLKKLAEVLRDSSQTSLFGMDIGQDLGEAICDAHVLVQISGKPQSVMSAEEAFVKNGRSFATVKELASLCGQSESAVRSCLHRAKKKPVESGEGLMAGLDDHDSPEPRPHSPRIEYRIHKVWPILHANIRK